MKYRIITFLLLAFFISPFFAVEKTDAVVPSCCYCQSSKGKTSLFYDITNKNTESTAILNCKNNRETYTVQSTAKETYGESIISYRSLPADYKCSVKNLSCTNLKKGIPCGTETCSLSQSCLVNRCYNKIGKEDSEADCKKKAQSLDGYNYIKDSKECYLTGDALKKYQQNDNDWIKIYQEIEPPKNIIHIPGLDFSSISSTLDSEGFIYMPWIGQYVSAVYKFAILAASILAIILIVVQGVVIMTSGGGEKNIESYKKIGKIFIGLAIAWGSYTILYAINPDLVEFKALKVQYIPEKDIVLFIDKGDPGSYTAINPKKLQDTTYDASFKKYAKQYNIDWRVLKAVAYKESSLDHNLINEFGFQGLFQFKKETCPESIKEKCNNLLDADNNTHAGAIMLSKNIKRIKSECSNPSDDVLFTLLYLSHNSGMGAVYCATKSTCTVETAKGKKEKINSNGSCNLKGIQQGVLAFWENHYKKKFVTNRGPRTYSYSVKTAQTIIQAKKILTP